MAVALRIDEYTTHEDGRIEVKFTAGPAPLPAGWGGNAWIFPSKGDLVEFLSASTTEWLTPELALRFVVAVWKQAQPGLTNPAVILGKTLTFDPASLMATMKVT